MVTTNRITTLVEMVTELRKMKEWCEYQADAASQRSREGGPNPHSWSYYGGQLAVYHFLAGDVSMLIDRIDPGDSRMRAQVIKAKRIQPPGIPADDRHVFLVRSVDGDFVDEGAGVWTLDRLTDVTVIVDEHGTVHQ